MVVTVNGVELRQTVKKKMRVVAVGLIDCCGLYIIKKINLLNR